MMERIPGIDFPEFGQNPVLLSRKRCQSFERENQTKDYGPSLEDTSTVSALKSHVEAIQTYLATQVGM